MTSVLEARAIYKKRVKDWLQAHYADSNCDQRSFTLIWVVALSEDDFRRAVRENPYGAQLTDSDFLAATVEVEGLQFLYLYIEADQDAFFQWTGQGLFPLNMKWTVVITLAARMILAKPVFGITEGLYYETTGREWME